MPFENDNAPTKTEVVDNSENDSLPADAMEIKPLAEAEDLLDIFE